MSPSTDQQLGMLLEAVNTLKTQVNSIETKVDALQGSEQRRSGAVRVLVLLSGVLGSVFTTVISRLWHQ